MDQVVNWFIIALMLVFDPLAIALVISANVVFSKPKDHTPPKPKGGLNDRPDVKQAMETASKLSEKHEIDKEEKIAKDFSSYYNDDGIDEWDFDEEDALDQVLNEMVEDIEDEIPLTTEDNYNEPIKEELTEVSNFKKSEHKIPFISLDKLTDVERLIEYVDNIGEECDQYKIKNGYKIPLNYLEDLKIDRKKLDYIKVNTPPFKGRIIIENDVCIIEHPNIYNKTY